MRTALLIFILTLSLSGCISRPAANDESVANFYYHPYGMVLTHEEWLQRGSSGKIVAHLKGGSVETIEYHEGKRHGKAEWTFPYSAIVARSCLYEQGTLLKECDHYTNGEPRIEVIYTPGRATRHVRVWYESGAPQAQEHWEGLRLIEATYFLPSGALQAHVVAGLGQRLEWEGRYLKAKEDYLDGWRTLREEYAPEGTLLMRSRYVQGRLDGLQEHFSPSGELVATQEWVEGQREGLYTEYLHGETITQVPYHGNKKEGIEKRYRRGELIETIDWLKGQRSGMHTLYAPGSVAKVEYYYRGSPVSKLAYEQIILHKQR